MVRAKAFSYDFVGQEFMSYEILKKNNICLGFSVFNNLNIVILLFVH